MTERHRLIRELWTDGACRVSTGMGGWAYVLRARRGDEVLREVQDCGSEPDSTCNAMELWAVIEGLGALHRPVTAPDWITVYSDATYVVDSFNRGWINVWRRNHWHTRDGRGKLRSIANPELWRVLDRLVVVHNIEWRLVKGHAGNLLNERVDRLAAAASKELPHPEEDE